MNKALPFIATFLLLFFCISTEYQTYGFPTRFYGMHDPLWPRAYRHIREKLKQPLIQMQVAKRERTEHSLLANEISLIRKRRFAGLTGIAYNCH